MVKRALSSMWAPAIAVIITIVVNTLIVAVRWGESSAQRERIIEDVRSLLPIAKDVAVLQQRVMALEERDRDRLRSEALR